MPVRPTICAICYVDPKTKQRGTNATTHICDACKRETINGERVNKQWVEDDYQREAIGRMDDVATDAKTQWSTSLAQLSERKIRTETELQVAIIELYALGLAVKTAYRDGKGRKRGTRRQVIDLSEEDVAFLLGIEQAYVSKVLRSVLEVSPLAETDRSAE